MQALGQRGVGDAALGLEDARAAGGRRNPGARSALRRRSCRRLLPGELRSSSAKFGINCPRFRGIMPFMPRSLTTASATALYVGAVLGPGVLLVPGSGRRGRRPGVRAGVGRAAAALLAARGHLRRARASGSRRPAGAPPTRAARSGRSRAGSPAGGSSPACSWARRRWRTWAGSTWRSWPAPAAARRSRPPPRWWRPSCWPTRAGSPRRRACSSRSSALLAAAPGRGGRVRAARGARRALDAVRAARLDGGRLRGQPADVLLHRLGGGLAPGGGAARPGAPAAAGGLRRARRRRRPLSRARGGHGRRARGGRAVLRAARRPDGRRSRRAGARGDAVRRGPPHGRHDEHVRRRRREPRRRARRPADAARRARSRSSAAPPRCCSSRSPPARPAWKG